MIERTPTALPVVETERLTLRRLDAEDADFIVELLNDPDFLRYIGDKKVRDRDAAIAYIRDGPMASYQQHGFGLYHVSLRDGGDAIGICGLLKRDALDDVDVGFALLPRFRARGFGAESAAAVLAYARERFGLTRVLAITSPDNAPSIRLLEKLGFRFERMAAITDGEPEVRVFGIAV